MLKRLSAPFVLLALLLLVLTSGGPASAHGFSSVVYADATSSGPGNVHIELRLEEDLLIYSAASAASGGHDDELVREGQAAWDSGDVDAQAKTLNGYADVILAYINDRFGVSASGEACAPRQAADFTVTVPNDDVPYLTVPLDYSCDRAATSHEIHSTLFPDAEGYVKDTKTIVAYDLDFTDGSAALDSSRTSFSTDQSTAARFWQFFSLGCEHLLTGLDHLLFLTALIAGSRRLREIVLAATTFTIAHSITLMLAALGIVSVPSGLVEPVIALSIAVVAGWYLFRLWRYGPNALEIDTTSSSHFALDRAGWARLGVVFCFGLIHGLGFAGALGIEQAWSWTLLWSLLVFNLGIEAVQLGLIALIFPVLAVVRRRSPKAGRILTGLIAAVVAVFGLFWFIERIAG